MRRMQLLRAKFKTKTKEKAMLKTVQVCRMCSHSSRYFLKKSQNEWCLKGQKLGFDHSFLFASHPLLSNTSVAQPMCKENKEGLFARMHPTNCHKVEAASQRRKKGTNACFLQPFQARYFYPPPPKQHLLYFSNPQSFSAHPPTSFTNVQH